MYLEVNLGVIWECIWKPIWRSSGVYLKVYLEVSHLVVYLAAYLDFELIPDSLLASLFRKYHLAGAVLTLQTCFAFS